MTNSLFKETESNRDKSTHDQTEALSLADRVAVLDQRRLLQFDKPEVIYDHPINTFVAGFLGSPHMNLLDANIFSNNQLPTMTRPVDRIGIWPEAIKMGNKQNSDNGLSLPAEIITQELVGGQVILYLSTPAGSMRAVVPREADGSINIGSHICLPYEHLHHFDAEGKRL